MIKPTQTSSNPSKTIGQRLNFLFLIVALSLTIFSIAVIRVPSIHANIVQLLNNGIAVEISNWDFAIFFALPCFASLIAALLLRLFDFDTDRRIQRCVNVALFFALLAIAVRVLSGPIVKFYMHSQGYSPCWHLSSPALMAPTAWVRNQGYCIENSGSVRKAVLQWMIEHPNGDADITPNDAKVKVNELLLDSDRNESY